MRATATTIVLLACTATPVESGELLKPLDPFDFQVNGYTTGGQGYPSAAADGTGRFLVTWQSFGSPEDDAAVFSIQGQAFDALGAADGVQFQVNTYTTGSQNVPVVAGLPEGFLVIWHSFGSGDDDVDGASIQARYLGLPPGLASGGTQFQVNTYTTGNQLRPDVDVDDAGNAVVVWENSGTSIEGILIAANGTPGSQFQINTLSTGVQTNASVAVAPAGHFVVVWESGSSGEDDSDGKSIQGQRYEANGAPQGSQFQVNVETTGDQFSPQVVFLDDDSFAVVWKEAAGGPALPEGPGTIIEDKVRGRSFLRAALKEIGVWDALRTSVSEQYKADLRNLPAFPYLLELRERKVPESLHLDSRTGGVDTSESFLSVSLLDPEETLGDEIPQVNTTFPGRQRDPAIAVGGSGRILAVWTNTPPLAAVVAGSIGASAVGPEIAQGAADLDDSIRARFLTLPIFVDDFEAGDTEHWSSTTE